MRILLLDRTRLVGGALLALWAAGAHAQPAQVKRAKPPQPIILYPQVAPAEPPGADKDEAKAAGATPANDAAALRASLVLGLLLEGGQSVDALFHSGDLTPEVARYILSERIDPWGSIEGRWFDNVRRDLAGLVWREGGAAFQKQALSPQGLPRSLRLWLADYLSSVSDEHVIAVGEQLLKDTPLPLSGDDGHGDKPLVFQTIERMARFLAAGGQQVESAQMWARTADVFDANAWWITDAQIEMARMYTSAGQGDKAKEFYDKAWNSGSQRFMALAVCDQARELMGRSQHAAAQKMLREALLALQGHNAQTLVQTFLASSLLASGDLEGAKTNAQEVLDAYAKMPPGQKPDEGTTGGLARETRDEAVRWLQSPIRVEPSEVLLPIGNFTRPLIKRLRVRTWGDVPLKVSSDNPGITVRLAESDDWGAKTMQRRTIEKEVIVEIAPAAMTKAAKANVILSSAKLAGVQTRVPVKVEAK